MRFDPERWEQVQSLFHDALSRSPSERRAFLEARCEGDPALLAAVLELLDADSAPSSLLDRDLADVANEVLESVAPPIRSIGPYRIRSVLGQGGMGVVYLADRKDLGSRVAIKVLRDAALSPARRERFASEQRALAQLNHPAIARLYDANVLPDGTPYFVMEFVEGVPLTTWCEDRNATVGERLALLRSACEAVQAAHQQAIVHRDLKPSNILVTPDGRVKLLDFGIAKQLEGLDVPADPTQTGLRLMTPAYAAPEQALGQPIGTYTDIYALGVLLYELLAGRLPFDLSRKTPGQVEAMIVERTPDRPSVAAAGRGTPLSREPNRAEWADLDVLCLTAMHKDPQRRYRTVPGLVRDIDHFLHAEPLDARPDSLTYRTSKFLRRHARAVTAAAAMLVALLALVTFYTVRLAAARDDALAEAARTSRIQDFMLNLFRGGNEVVGPADTLRVLTLIDRGTREAAVLDAEPAVQAELLYTLGTLYQQRGQLDRADSLLHLAHDRYRRLEGERGQDVARSLVAIGMLRVDQARLDDAERDVRTGLDVARRSLSPTDAVTLEAEVALGRVLQEKGEYEEAIGLLEAVVRTRSHTAPGSPELADAMIELANTHFYAGHLEASDSLNRIVLAMDRHIYGERHPVIADVLINLGATQFQWGMYAEAERYYREALGMTEAFYGPDHPTTASNLTMLGRALNYENRTDEALGMLRRALGIEERVYGPVHPAVASTLNDIALIALAREDYAGAEEGFRRMAAIYDSIYSGPHWLKAVARANLGSVYLAAGRYTDAERLLHQSVDLYAATLGADNMNTAIARIKLGRSLARQKRWAEAERESRAGYDQPEGPDGPRRQLAPVSAP